MSRTHKIELKVPKQHDLYEILLCKEGLRPTESHNSEFFWRVQGQLTLRMDCFDGVQK